jgi:DNA invertase Pin-like site-specific DNA recombinase
MAAVTQISFVPSEGTDKREGLPYLTDKITPRHLSREAAVYLRVSTPKQVEYNQESLRYQMSLTGRAIQLGWPVERIQVITTDLGVSAIQGVRTGFWKLLNDTAEGKFGIIFVFESSRAARKIGDMCALLDAAELSGTLIADYNKIYDPRDFNDRMALYLSGIIDEAEGHRFRMRGVEGRMQQVVRGAYRQRLPVGLVRLPDGGVVKHQELRVQEAINLVFRKFGELRSCGKVLCYLGRAKIELPRFRYSGPHKGRLIWTLPDRSAILEIIRSPAYAGAFAYGRRQTIPSYKQKGGGATQRKPMEQWVIVHDVYEAYITWDQYLANNGRLAELTSKFKKKVEKSPGDAREGAALLTGVVRCGTCGAKMKVFYSGGARYFCDAQVHNYGTDYCPSFHACSVDRAVVDSFFEAINPSQVDALDAACARQAEEDERARRQLGLRIEEARKEVRLAEDRYTLVDPHRRLVVEKLEAQWEEKLSSLRDLEAESVQLLRQQRSAVNLDSETRKLLQNISETLPKLWEGGELSNSQKKEFIRSLISKVVLKRIAPDMTEARIAWHSGGCSVISVSTPTRSTADLPSYSKMLERIEALWRGGLNDAAIAAKLTAEGHRTARNDHVLRSSVGKIRREHGLSSPVGRSRDASGTDNYLSTRELAARIGAKLNWVYSCLWSGGIPKEFIKPRARQDVWLIKDDPALIERLRQEAALMRNKGR